MKKLIAVITTVGLLTVVGASAAGAATNGTAGSRRGADSARVGQRRTLARHAVRTAISAAADAIGISPADLVKGIRSGKTVAEVAQANNVQPQAVVDAVVKTINTKIDGAVTNGKLKEPVATRIKAHLSDRAAKFVNDTRHPGQGKGAKGRHPVARTAITTSADAIGISPVDLLTGLRDGKTVAAVAQANNVEPKTVIDAIVKTFTTKIDQAVDNGKMRAPIATRIKSHLAERATKFVNETPHRAQRKAPAKAA